MVKLLVVQLLDRSRSEKVIRFTPGRNCKSSYGAFNILKLFVDLRPFTILTTKPMPEKITREQLASTSHDIQVGLGSKGVPEFESVPFIGMMVNLALHIRGLPLIEYEKFKLVAAHFFHIPPAT